MFMKKHEAEQDLPKVFLEMFEPQKSKKAEVSRSGSF